MSSDVIVFDNVSKAYDLSGGVFAVKDLLERFKNGRLFSRTESAPASNYLALKNVSFRIRQGERVGLVGANGAGKSTTLKLINRVAHPSSGQVRITGTTGGLIELGSGFNMELSGRDNIFLNSAIYGWTPARTRTAVDQIAALAELTDFIDVPVKKYSSGMKVRLAFAVAVAHSPDIVLLDEVLAVGDMRFREKCMEIIEDYMAGKTVLFVSHSFAEVMQVCERVLVFNHGELCFDGAPAEAEAAYLDLIGMNAATPRSISIPVNLLRGKPEIAPLELAKVECVGAAGVAGERIGRGQPAHVRCQVRAQQAVADGAACSIHLRVKNRALGNLTEVIGGQSFPFTWEGDDEQSLTFTFDTTCLWPAVYLLEAWVEVDGQSALAERKVLSMPFEISDESADESVGVVDLGFRPLADRPI